MENIEKPTTINSDSAPISEKYDTKDGVLSIEQQKDEINKKYLPSLSSFQKISVKLKNEQNDDTKIEIRPDANYEEFNVGYYIFYNNNLLKLKELYELELKTLTKKHPVVLYHIKDFLKKLDQRFDEDIYYNPVRLFSLLVSYSYQPIVENARALANNLIKIKEIEKNGTDMKSKFSQIIIKDGVEDIFKDISNINDKRDNNYIDYNPEEYTEIENKFYELQFKYKDNLSYINELEKIFDKYYYEKIGEVSVEVRKRNGFCFILNRASYYLESVEKGRSYLDFEVLKKCDKLRRKINILLLNHRYKFGQNSRPILDIEIARYKILNNDFETVSIYIDKDELKSFIEKLEEAFQNKASNLKENNNFEFLDIKEIKEIAALSDIKIISNEQLKDGIKEKIEELNFKKKEYENELKSIYTEYLKTGITLVSNYALGNPSIQIPKKKSIIESIFRKEENDNNTDKKSDEGQRRIDQLELEIEKIKKRIQNYEYKIQKINININYDVTFINILKLYFKLVRKQYQIRNDYEGIIITEKKKMILIKHPNDLYQHFEEEEKFREYEIIEIYKGN